MHAYSIVYKGYIVKEQGSIVIDTVAIKTLKGVDIMYPYGHELLLYFC